MKITDEMIAAAIPKACDLWLTTYPDDLPPQAASPRFEQKMERLLTGQRRRISFKYALIAAILTALTLTVGTFAAESDWIDKTFYPALPLADGPDFTITEAKPIEPISEDHLTLHDLPYAPELWKYVGGLDLYIGNAHPVDGYYGCEKHDDDSHFVSVSEKLTVQRKTCTLCGHKELGYGIETIKTCLTDPDLDAYAFCDRHEACEPFDKTAEYFTGWTVYSETEYTEWEEDRSADSHRTSPCTNHNHFAHDQVEQIRYAVTEYQCPDCPKVVPYAELERRSVCYTRTEGLTYAARPMY